MAGGIPWTSQDRRESHFKKYALIQLGFLYLLEQKLHTNQYVMIPIDTLYEINYIKICHGQYAVTRLPQDNTN